MKLIKINYSLYYYLLILFLAGLLKDGMIIFLIILVHELGHVFFAYIFKFKILSITLYPFGGITKIEKKLNTNPKKDLLISLGGIKAQLLLLTIFYLMHKQGVASTNTYLLFNKYNIFIMLFNILPIIPLDGAYVLDAILNSYFSFYKSYIINFIISIIFLIIFILIFKDMIISLNIMCVVIFMIFKIKKYYSEKNYIYNKFLLERALYNFDYSKINNEKNGSLKDLKKNTYFYFWNKNKWLSEKRILINKFLK